MDGKEDAMPFAPLVMLCPRCYNTDNLLWEVPMKKRLVCLLLCLSLCVPFASALEGEARRAADTLRSYGLVQGTPAGDDLESLCTRAQALVLLYRLGGFPAGQGTPYADVPAWAAAEVSALSGAGILAGIFDPPLLQGGEYISPDEWSALLLRLCGIAAETEDAALYARRLGVIPREYTSPLSRGEVFEMTCSALSYAYDGATLAQHLGLEAPGERLLELREVADHASAAVFSLECYANQRSYDKGKLCALGTGFFLTADGVAVTCHHVLEKAEMATVILSTGEEFPVEGVLWFDEAADLALIRVSPTSVDEFITTPAFATLPLTTSREVYPGDRVYTIGNALGVGLSVSEGAVASVDKDATLTNLPVIVFSAPISPGSSGGPLFNQYGRVVAVTAGAYTEGNSLYISIPADCLMELDLTTLTAVPLKEALN